jgi:hypothetical protein
VFNDDDKVVLLNGLTGAIKYADHTLGKFVYTDCGRWFYYFKHEINQNIKKVE